MDLTRLYNLTTPELREEAERLGVADTYAMSRGQLIHAIREHAGQPPQDGFLGKVFGFAKWALQAASETRGEGQAIEVGTAAEPVPVPNLSAEPNTRPAAAPDLDSVAEPAADSEPAPTPVEQTPAEAPPGPPSRPPVGVFSSSPGLFEEPFPTRTMARILADQGHFKRSLAIYARLLSDEPSNGELSAEADHVREQARARRAHAPH